MKLVIFALVFFSQLAHADADLINKGNALFAKSQFKEAIDIYKTIEAEGRGGFGFYSNIARSYAHIGEDALAILYFEKALKLKPNNDEIAKDLAEIRRRNPDLDTPIEPFWMQQLYIGIVGAFMPGTWGVLSLMALAMMGFLLLASAFRKVAGVRLKIALVFIGCIFLFSLTAAYYRDLQVYHHNGLIIVAENVKLKAGPDQLSPDVVEIPTGAKVFTSDNLGIWLQVTNEYGDIGWVKKTDVRSI